MSKIWFGWAKLDGARKGGRWTGAVLCYFWFMFSWLFFFLSPFLFLFG